MDKHLDVWSMDQGWRVEQSGELIIHVARNEKYMRGPEPRFSSTDYPSRSTYGRFVDEPHSAGCWYQLESEVPSMSNRGVHLGYSVECIIHVLRQAAPPSSGSA